MAPKHRVTVAEAARILDTNAATVRSQIKRGMLESTKEEGGTVYVLLPPKLVAAQTPPGPTSQQPDTGQKTDRTRLAELVARDELVDELRDRVHFLEGQLEQANERDRENRRIIAALTTRIPELPRLPLLELGRQTRQKKPAQGLRRAWIGVMDALERGRRSAPSGSVVARARRWWEGLWR